MPITALLARLTPWRARLDPKAPDLSPLGTAAIALALAAAFLGTLALTTTTRTARAIDAEGRAALRDVEASLETVKRELVQLAARDVRSCGTEATRAIARQSMQSDIARAFYVQMPGDAGWCGLLGLEAADGDRFVAQPASTGDGGLIVGTARTLRPMLQVALADARGFWLMAEVPPRRLYQEIVGAREARGRSASPGAGGAPDGLAAALSGTPEDAPRAPAGVPFALRAADGSLLLATAAATADADTVGRELDPVLARVVLASSSLPVSLHAELRASDVWRAMRGAVLPWLVAALAIALGATLLIDQRLAARGSPERRMLRAMRKRQFEPVAQPIVSLATGECVGAEVLMRWAHPVRGLLPPAEFIALAEESGMIVPMSEILMRKARDQLAPLARRYPHLYFSFNVTSAQLRDPAFPAKARAIFDEVSLPPRAVLLELIEREAVDRQGELALAQLRSLGFRLAMDDFGTGESSLASLQALAFDRIKVDREFVRTIDEHSRRRPVLDTVIRLGHDLGVPLIAEGVETRAQWDYLSARGVQAVQGFLVARPMPIDAFGRWLDEHARKAPSVAGSDDGEGAALDAGPQIERDALAHG